VEFNFEAGGALCSQWRVAGRCRQPAKSYFGEAGGCMAVTPKRMYVR